MYDYDSKREVFGSYSCDTYTVCGESLSCYDKYIGCNYETEVVCTTLTFPVVEEEVTETSQDTSGEQEDSSELETASESESKLLQ